CVGDPLERFGEDALRILRAIRFSAQLGYEIDGDTRDGIRKLAPALRNISAERIQTELVKLITSPHPEDLRTAYELGVTKVFFPEFDVAMETEQKHPHHKYNVGEHTLHSLSYVKPDKKLRLAMLLHDIGKPATLTMDESGVTHFHEHPVVGEKMAEDFLRRLKFDNDTIHGVCKLVLYHDYGNSVEPDMRVVRRAVNKIGEDVFPALFEIKRADVMAQSDYMRQEKLELIDSWERLYRQVQEQNQCVSLKDLAVNGSDLIRAGWKPGKELGSVLQKLLDLVLEQPQCNTRETLLAEAEKYKEKP
ncbi:MAG: HD domain-containing protein, partial [Acetatifactor sp.]|nr:HD domain-containing protein [Acetatifactor sp.]